MGWNLPDDWGSHYRNCGKCGRKFHASDGACDYCLEAAERQMSLDWEKNKNKNSPVKQVCAVCGVVHEVPKTSQVNHCTVEVHHHYGSEKDGEVETFDICVACIKKLITGKPIDSRN